MRDPGDALLFAPELLPGERVLWTGRPHAPAAARAAWPTVPFGLFWTALSGAVLVQAWREGEWVGVAFVALFVGVGALMLLAPAWAYATAQATRYALTERRLLTARVDRRRFESILLSSVSAVERTRLSDGRQTIRVPRRYVVDAEGDAKQDHLVMTGVADGDRAYRLLVAQGREAA